LRKMPHKKKIKKAERTYRGARPIVSALSRWRNPKRQGREGKD